MKAEISIFLLRQHNDITQTGLSKSAIYIFTRDKQFKVSIKLGERVIGWLETSVEEFLVSSIKANRPDNELGVR